MTQEELDALMAGELDMEEMDAETEAEDAGGVAGEDEEVVTPPPATPDHKVVHQLDDVTRDSEEKASEIFDALDGVMNDAEETQNDLERMKEIAGDLKGLFDTLIEKFPHVQKFHKAKEEAEEMEALIEASIGRMQNASDQILGAMDTMQYQDIHRQKIERVINIMRALSKYMSALFEGKVDDEQRVKSARHIEGDTHTEEVISNDDIEALIAQFGGS